MDAPGTQEVGLLMQAGSLLALMETELWAAP